MKIKYYLIGIVLLVFSFFLDSYVKFPTHPILDYLLSSIFNFVTIFILFVVVSIVFLYEEGKQRWVVPLMMSALCSIVFSVLLKMLIARQRPDMVGILDMSFTKYSFPSSHTALVFAALPILDKEFKKIKIFWITFAIVVGLSRIYFNVHFFSDVIAGALLGYLLGDIFYNLEKKYKWFK